MIVSGHHVNAKTPAFRTHTSVQKRPCVLQPALPTPHPAIEGPRRPARIGAFAGVKAAGMRELDHHTAGTVSPGDRGAIKSTRTRAHPTP